MRPVVTIAISMTVALAAFAMETDRLIAGLVSESEAARAEARQLLPRQPVEAVANLIPLVTHEDHRIATAAMRTLEDFIGEVTVAGREDDRRFVTRHIMSLVRPNQNPRALDAGFRLVPLVVPEGYDLGPLARWLNHSDTREAARTSLELAGTRQARNALRAALTGADAPFQIALLDSLAHLEDTQSIVAASRLLPSPNFEVQVAVSRLLARAGGLNEAPAIQRVMREAIGDNHREAAESYAVLAGRILEAGGNWDRGIAMLVEMLEESPDATVKGIAIASLGRYGDERVIAHILAALEAEGGEALEPQAVAAFQDLEGPAVRERLLAAHGSLSPSMQVRMLDAYARKHDRRFLEIILAGAQSKEREALRIAMAALSASGFPEAIDGLVRIAETSDDDFRYEVLRVLETTAARMEAQGDRDAAGRAYLAVYRHTDLPVVRRMALAGIKRCPIPDAYEVILAEIDAGGIEALPVDLLAGVTRALFDQGRTVEAERALDALLVRATAAHELEAVITALHGAPGVGDLRPRLGIITAWQVAGPFEWDMDDAFTVINISEPDIDLSASYAGMSGGDITWKTVTTDSGHGFVNLSGVLGAYEHCTAYAFATVTLGEETSGHIRVGSDDGIKVWVNGEAVLERNVDRGMALDQDSAPVTLRAGENQILLEVSQNLAGWGFVARLTAAHGRPVTLSSNEDLDL